MWSEIKYALNSTLGTSKFKPLDTILKDSIEENISIAPSETELLGEAGIEYTVRYDGQVFLNYTVSVLAGKESAFYASVKLNDVTQTWTSDTNRIKVISVKKGDTISFNVIPKNSYTSVTEKFIGGKVQLGKTGLY